MLDKKTKEIIKIIKQSIIDKDIDLDTSLEYLCMVLYAAKYNLKLGYVLDDVTNTLGCTKVSAEKGLKLLKKVNYNVLHNLL